MLGLLSLDSIKRSCGEACRQLAQSALLVIVASAVPPRIVPMVFAMLHLAALLNAGAKPNGRI